MPAARSCDPATALNLISTKPSLMLASFFSSSGYVARPDCLSTFDFDGAVASLSTVHFGSPDPVRVEVQPSGATPVCVLSKLIAWFDMALTPVKKSVAAMMVLRRRGRDIGRIPAPSNRQGPGH